MLSLNTTTQLKTLTLNPSDYPGGIAIWGALPAVIDNTQQPFDQGIHVHARKNIGQSKVIDSSFDVVDIQYKDKHISVNKAMAVAFTMSSIFNISIRSLDCDYCNTPLLDQGIQAVIPSHEHVCQQCNAKTYSVEACITNPILELKRVLNDHQIQRPATIPMRSINLDQRKFPQGFQVWGSNPSIIWTAPRQEESAIHIHAFNDQGKRVIDNTYGCVTLNNIKLNIAMIRVLQIQMAIPQISKHLTLIRCPHCRAPIFDKALCAVIPNTHKFCLNCQKSFVTPKSISNPMIELRRKYHANHH